MASFARKSTAKWSAAAIATAASSSPGVTSSSSSSSSSSFSAMKSCAATTSLRALFSSAGGKRLYTPNDSQIKQTQMTAFANRISATFDQDVSSFAQLHKWSVTHTGPFWAAVADFCAVKWIHPPQAANTLQSVYTPPPAPHKMRGAKWFKGGMFNFAENVLPAPTDDEVLIAVYESGTTVRFTGRQLHNEVARCSAALQQAGVRKGDRVAGVLTNSAEAIICMLATTSLGAIWSSCSPDFGVEGIADRLGQVQPKVVFIAMAYRYNGKKIDCAHLLQPVCDRLPSMQMAVGVPYLGDNPDAAGGNDDDVTQSHNMPLNYVGYAKFLGKLPDAGVVSGGSISSSNSKTVPRSGFPEHDHTGAADVMKIHFEPVPFDHPVYIMFSSGTTGLPKCIVHGGGGTLLQHKKELMLHCDVKSGDRLCYFTTTGWMMWNWMATTLSVKGASLVTYEGSPAYPRVQRLWELAALYQLSHLGTSPKYLTACMAAEARLNRHLITGGGGGDGGGGVEKDERKSSNTRTRKRLLEGLDLSNLRCLVSTGSPLLPEHFDWVYESVKHDVHVASISGGTDIMGCFMCGNPNLPVHSGEIQCLGLGMDVVAYDDDSKRPAAIGEKAELVCRTPFPSMPLGFWGDDVTQTKYHSAYFDRDGTGDTSKSEMWYHGDFIEISPHGGVVVHGRSDATLNPGGVRIGTAEIYRTLEAMPEVEDSVAVGHRQSGDEDIVLFVKLVGGTDKMTEKLALDIKHAVRQRLTPRHVPRHVIAVTDIPYTRSGKKVEIGVAKAIHGEEVKNVTALANPEALDEFYNMPGKLATLNSKL